MVVSLVVPRCLVVPWFVGQRILYEIRPFVADLVWFWLPLLTVLVAEFQKQKPTSLIFLCFVVRTTVEINGFGHMPRPWNKRSIAFLWLLIFKFSIRCLILLATVSLEYLPVSMTTTIVFIYGTFL